MCLCIGLIRNCILLTIMPLAQDHHKYYITSWFFTVFFKGFHIKQGAARMHVSVCTGLIRYCILLTIMPFVQDHHKYYITCRFFTVFSRGFHIKTGYGMHVYRSDSLLYITHNHAICTRSSWLYATTSCSARFAFIMNMRESYRAVFTHARHTGEVILNGAVAMA